MEDTLPNAIGVDCLSIPEIDYDINESARYVRFIAKSFFDNGPSLQYLHLDYDYPSGVVENTDLCPSMCANFITQFMDNRSNIRL